MISLCECIAKTKELAVVIPGVVVFEGLKERILMTLPEAMDYVLSVIANRKSGIAEFLVDGEAGLLVPPGLPKSLAGVLSQPIGRHEMRKQMNYPAVSGWGSENHSEQNAPKSGESTRKD